MDTASMTVIQVECVQFYSAPEQISPEYPWYALIGDVTRDRDGLGIHTNTEGVWQGRAFRVNRR